MDHRDDADDEGPEDEAEDENGTQPASEKAPPPKAEGKTRKGPSSKAARSGRESREAKSSAREPTKQVSAGGPLSSALARTIVAAVVALAAGVAVGWFGHDAQAKAKLRADSSPAAAGSSGPCNDWQQKICAGSGGEQSAACQQAKGASELLTSATCEAALAGVPATLAKVKAARASCDNLVAKLCKDLPKDSSACSMVKERTPSLPPDRCKGMLEQYDQVLAQLKMLDAQGGGPQMGRPPGAPPGAMHQGAPPGAMHQGAPPGAMPQGAPHQ
jgi:hypothetical protein